MTRDHIQRLLEMLRNMTLQERPIQTMTLVSAADAALAGAPPAVGLLGVVANSTIDVYEDRPRRNIGSQRPRHCSR
jgi:hypothetical protein